MDINKLQKLLEMFWSKETSENPGKWSKDNPAMGHCLISAFIGQDNCGGEILQAKLGGLRQYYWNRLPGGEEIHLTRSQLPESVVIPEGRVRKRLMLERALRRFRPDALEKYRILKRRVQAGNKIR